MVGVVVPVSIPYLGEIDLFKDYSYLIKLSKKEKKLNNYIKNVKIKCSMNMIL